MLMLSCCCPVPCLQSRSLPVQLSKCQVTCKATPQWPLSPSSDQRSKQDSECTRRSRPARLCHTRESDTSPKPHPLRYPYTRGRGSRPPLPAAMANLNSSRRAPRVAQVAALCFRGSRLRAPLLPRVGVVVGAVRVTQVGCGAASWRSWAWLGSSRGGGAGGGFL